jgi:hypothetical protein
MTPDVFGQTDSCQCLSSRMRCFSAGSGLQSTNIRYAATSLTNNDICTILIRDFSKEQHELPENDKQGAIETCRSLLSVLV